jgi:hypothetical protein
MEIRAIFGVNPLPNIWLRDPPFIPPDEERTLETTKGITMEDTPLAGCMIPTGFIST